MVFIKVNILVIEDKLYSTLDFSRHSHLSLFL